MSDFTANELRDHVAKQCGFPSALLNGGETDYLFDDQSPDDDGGDLCDRETEAERNT